MSKTMADIINDIEEAGLENEIEAFYKWREEQKRTKKAEEEIRTVIHVNSISRLEMKAHTKEMRSEMNRKFVKSLMEQGLTAHEAVIRVRKWDGVLGVGMYGN